MARSKDRLKARELRRTGESIKDIAKILNVSVGSVSSWCRDIQLSKNQIKKLQRRVTDPYYGKKAAYLQKMKEEFEKKVNALRQEGLQEIGSLSEREIFLIGIALYWAEGFKKDHQVGFANIDVKMIKFFILWLKQCFDIDKSELIIRVTANINSKRDINKMEQYWSDELAIPLNQFSKPFFQKISWKKTYENKTDYHGVLRIKVRRSVNLLRKLYGCIEGLTID